jgi:hypothetical protein
VGAALALLDAVAGCAVAFKYAFDLWKWLVNGRWRLWWVEVDHGSRAW